MAGSYIQVPRVQDPGGPRLKTVESTQDGQAVQSLAVTAVDTAGQPLVAVRPELKSVVLGTDTAGTSVVIAAVPGRRIKVHGFTVQVVDTLPGAAPLRVHFQDSAGTDLTGTWAFHNREGIAMTAGEGFWLFATVAGRGVDIVLGDAVGVAGLLSYWDSDPD